MSKSSAEEPDLPLWAKACIGVIGSFLLLPFVLPALSLMLLAAVPVIVCFVPWVSLNLLPARTTREIEPERSSAARRGGRPGSQAEHAHAA